MRILIYTGKGGVGKTSMAAAAACALAKKGRRVIVMSTDQAHSLGDSFGVKLDDEPTQIIDNLQAVEINTMKESKRAWGSLQDYIKQVINKDAQGSLESDEVVLFPSLEELFAMLRIRDEYLKKSCDVLILDCAPTGETLSLLRFPERLGAITQRFLPLIRFFNMTAGFAVRRATKVPRPIDRVFVDFDHLIDDLRDLQKIMSDPAVTSIRIVTTPEKIVLDEARRNYTWMHMYGFNVDSVIINRIYPDEAMSGYFSGWIDLQAESIRLAQESFAGSHIFRMPLKDHELRGVEALAEAAREVYGDEDLEEVYTKDELFHIEGGEEGTVFVISLPFSSKEEIEVGQHGDDILVSMRNERRRFHIPETVRHRTLVDSEYKDGLLKVYLS